MKYIPLYPQAPRVILTLTLFMLKSTPFLGPERLIVLSLGQMLAGCLSQMHATHRQHFLSIAGDAEGSCRTGLQTLDTCPGIILWMFFRLITRRGPLCSGLEVGLGTIQHISDWFVDRKRTKGQRCLLMPNLSFCPTRSTAPKEISLQMHRLQIRTASCFA